MDEEQRKPPRAPAGLGRAGRHLWRQATMEYDFSAGELSLLEEACLEKDLLAQLRRTMDASDVVTEGSQGQEVAHPLLTELRLHRTAFIRLVSSLNLPADDGPAARDLARARSVSARKAAIARWST